MRQAGILLIVVLGLLSSCGGDTSSTPREVTTSALQSYIVVLHEHGAPADTSGRAFGLSHAPSHVYTHALNGFAAKLSPAEAARLAADPRVRFVEPDVSVSILQGKGGGGGNGKGKEKDGGGGGGGGDDGGGGSTQQTGWGIERIGAQQSGGRGAGVTVAVLDTGIDLTHPDLAGAIVVGYDATGNGTPNDGNGHGTHVAGIIGARDNNIGYVGVAPECSLAAVRVLSSTGGGQLSWILDGMEWTIANQSAYNIRVANMSFGAVGHSAALEAAIDNATAAGIVCVAAAGNSFIDAAGVMPARYANTLAVSAMNSNGTFAAYSNWGSVIDLIAPGTNVPSLWRGGGYHTTSGTSMAAPHVAGALALWLDDNDGSFSEAKSTLLSAGLPGPWPGDPDGIDEPEIHAASL